MYQVQGRMKMINPLEIRSDFPFFHNNPGLVYLDNAATTQKPSAVIERISRFYESENTNIHRGIYDKAEKATEYFETVRKKAADFINCSNPQEIIFTSGTTEGINMLAKMLGETLKSGDRIVFSEAEHHANIVPWQILASNRRLDSGHITLKDNLEYDTDSIQKIITQDTKIVSISQCSNVTGKSYNTEKITEAAHKAGAVVIVDAAQSVPHFPVDIQKLGCDFLVFSGHKMCGPTGTGILWGRSEYLENLEPQSGGGDMIRSVKLDHSEWNTFPYKFEPGTPNIAGVIGLGEAFDYIKQTGIKNIEEYLKNISTYAYEMLKYIPGINIIGSVPNTTGIYSFYHDSIHPHDLSHILNKYGICVRAGRHCAHPLHTKLGIASSLRLSLYFYNTVDEIEIFADKLKKAVSLF